IPAQIAPPASAGSLKPSKREALSQSQPSTINSQLFPYAMKLNWARLHALALEEVEATLAGLPEPLRARSSALPITFERRPNRGQLEDGIEADTLGLFIGPEFADEESTSVPLPPQIILFLENLWDQ